MDGADSGKAVGYEGELELRQRLEGGTGILGFHSLGRRAVATCGLASLETKHASDAEFDRHIGRGWSGKVEERGLTWWEPG